MRNSPDRSVRSKVMLVVLATTVAALFVVAIALIVYESRTYERSTAEGLMTQAQILARTTAPALVFDDPAAARDNLALLKVQPQILAAAIYMKGGRLFASYGNAELFGIGSTRTPPAADGYTIEGGEIVVFRRITEDREFLGTVYLRARYELDARLRDYLGILGVVLIASLALTLLLSATLQRAITQPILDVTAVARQVIERRDFSLRVEKTTHDEIGYLVDAFNGMLAEVGRRAEALEASNATLSRESAERRDAEEALRVADRRKDEFLAMLAHELRNPLAPLRNALEILKHADGNPRAAAEARQMMERQLRQMVRLVDDLLDVSRITTGKLALKTEVCELHDILRNALDTARPLIDARGHSLSVVEPDEPVRIHGDPTRLAQVFANLLNNAANYTEPGGRIDLVAVADAQTATISVIDNGIGIAREMLQPVFQMFAQADESLERVHGGLGVGLTLARHLVELHSGTIDAHSEGIGRGSTFIVRLPRTFATPAQTSERRRPETRTSTTQRRVLIADDNVDFAMSLEAILDALGHDVRVTHDGLAAIAAAEEFAPEIAFIDIGLPGRDGYSVARALRELPATASSTLVAVTGWGQDDDRRRSLDAGFGIHLVKPVEPQQIIDVVNAAAPARAAV